MSKDIEQLLATALSVGEKNAVAAICAELDREKWRDRALKAEREMEQVRKMVLDWFTLPPDLRTKNEMQRRMGTQCCAMN